MPFSNQILCRCAVHLSTLDASPWSGKVADVHVNVDVDVGEGRHRCMVAPKWNVLNNHFEAMPSSVVHKDNKCRRISYNLYISTLHLIAFLIADREQHFHFSILNLISMKNWKITECEDALEHHVHTLLLAHLCLNSNSTKQQQKRQRRQKGHEIFPWKKTLFWFFVFEKKKSYIEENSCNRKEKFINSKEIS